MKMSDVIADFIGEMLSDGGGVAELQRKSLADRFSCVPSQINYVIETRFTPEHGYLVESQRGGGGFIRIEKRKGVAPNGLEGSLMRITVTRER